MLVGYRIPDLNLIYERIKAIIVQVCSNLDPRIGGPYQVILAINEYCVESEREIQTFSFGGVDTDFAIVLPSFMKNSYGFIFPFRAFNLFKSIRQSSLIIIHGYYLFSTLLVVFLSKRHNRIILFPHGSLNASQINKSKFPKYVFNIFFRSVTKRMNIFFACTGNQELLDVKNQFPTFRTFQTLLGSRLGANVQKSYSGVLKLLTISRIHPIKNLEYSLALVSLLKSNGISVKYLHIGDGPEPYMFELQQLAASLSIEDCVEFRGSQEVNSIKDSIDDASFLLQLSHYENYGISVAEAISRCTPVIVTPNVGIATFVRENACGLVVELGNVQSLFDQLTKNLSSYSKLVSNCRAAQEKLKWNKIIEKWVN
jgi:glycosyltransferase involved in cell wall biosynthesis